MLRGSGNARPLQWRSKSPQLLRGAEARVSVYRAIAKTPGGARPVENVVRTAGIRFVQELRCDHERVGVFAGLLGRGDNCGVGLRRPPFRAMDGDHRASHLKLRLLERIVAADGDPETA